MWIFNSAVKASNPATDIGLFENAFKSVTNVGGGGVKFTNRMECYENFPLKQVEKDIIK
jgi:hypothetical protein